jgi:hypothetical protein
VYHVSFAIVLLLDALLLNSWCLKRVDSTGEKQGQQAVNLAKVRAKGCKLFR